MRVRYLCSRQQPNWPAVPAVDTWTSQPLPRPPASVAPVDLEPPAPDALLLVYEQNKSCLTLVLFQGPIKLVCHFTEKFPIQNRYHFLNASTTLISLVLQILLSCCQLVFIKQRDFRLFIPFTRFLITLPSSCLL